MYRVCVGYVSGMCRESVERYRERKGFRGHGKRGNNYLLRAEREKSKLSKLQTDYYLQQQEQHKSTTIALATTQRALRGIGRPLNCTERHGNQKDLVSLRERQETIVRPKGDKKSKLSKLKFE